MAMNSRPLRAFFHILGGALLLVGQPALSAQPTPPADSASGAVAAVNALACDLYRQIAPAPGDNVFFSPTSLTMALTMTWAGARGDTAAQMAKALHLDKLPADQITPAFHALQNALAKSNANSSFQLAIANSLWPQSDHLILPAYLKTIRDDYGAAIFPVDYKTQAEAVRLRVNTWVGEQTQQRIQNLLQAEDVADTTRLILVNAIYFKAEWEEKFNALNNENAPFSLPGGASKPVSLLHKKIDGARYAEIADPATPMQILALPYQHGALEFIALLPRSADALPALEKNLTAEKLAAWLGPLSAGFAVNVYLPKFKLNTRYNLGPTLQKMGMADAFTQRADFSGMDGARDLLISGVVHQAFVEVNESGTEAAAASGVAVGILAMRADPVPVFRADHPFLFLIRDPASGVILFLGRFATPPD